MKENKNPADSLINNDINHALDLPISDPIIQNLSITDNRDESEQKRNKYNNEFNSLIKKFSEENQDKNLELINDFLKNNQKNLTEENIESLKESLKKEPKIKNFEDVNNLIDIHNFLNNTDKSIESDVNSFGELMEKFKKEPTIINDDTKISLFNDFINKKNDKKLSPADFNHLMSKLDIKDDNKKTKLTIDFIESDKCEENNLENLLRGLLTNDKSKSNNLTNAETISDAIDLIESRINDNNNFFKNPKIIEKLIKNLPNNKNIQNDLEYSKLIEFINKHEVDPKSIDIISNFSKTISTDRNSIIESRLNPDFETIRVQPDLIHANSISSPQEQSSVITESASSSRGDKTVSLPLSEESPPNSPRVTKASCLSFFDCFRRK